MPFTKSTLAVSTSDGHNFALDIEHLQYTANDGTVYRSVMGATTDGASVPRELWNIYPPFGLYWLAAVLHDCAYRAMLEKLLPNGTWLRVQLAKADCDNLLLEAMTGLGVDASTRGIIYHAVSAMGDSSFVDDLAKPIN